MVWCIYMPDRTMNIFLIFFIICLSVLAILTLWFLRYCELLINYKKADPGIKEDADYKPLISIIIPTYNEELMIGNKIKNTFELIYPKDKREVIVVDSASTDNTINIVKSFDSLILITQKERKGKSHALAEAFKQATGELLLITDADAMLNKDVLEKIVPVFADNTLGAATGKLEVLGKESASKTSEKAYRTFFDILRIFESRIAATMIFNGPLMVFRASIIEPPSENSVADDTEMALQVIRKGYRTMYIPEAIFLERVPSSNKIRLMQKERRAQGLVQSFIRHRDMIFNDKYGMFGKVIFPAEFIVHILLPFALVIAIFSMIPAFLYEPAQTLIIAIAVAAGVMAYAVNIYRKLEGKIETETKSDLNDIIVTIITFLQLEFALFKGAVKLLLFGSSHKWEQIKEVRSGEVTDKQFNS
jgi:biofilm PGA synthesis N-glycosyltransferase PgaC